MSTLTLVRHGQANSAATTEEDYDRLSDIGREQAQHLGDHFRYIDTKFDAIFAGTLHRQQDTAQALRDSCQADLQTDKRLNEIEYYTLTQQLIDQFDIDRPTGEFGHVKHFHTLYDLWSDDKIENPPETYENYETRVRNMLEDMRHAGPNVLAVTSGGIIAMAIKLALGLDNDGLVKCLLAGMNTGVTKLHYINGSFGLLQMNAMPHLEHPDRLDLRTFY